MPRPPGHPFGLVRRRFLLPGSRPSRRRTKYNTGQTGWWTFDSPHIVGTTVRDFSGNDRNGTLQGSPQPIAGQLGQGLKFNGSSDYVSTGVSAGTFGLTSAWTIVSWVRPLGTVGTVSEVYSGKGIFADIGGGYNGLYRANISGVGDRIWAYNWDVTEKRAGVAYTSGERMHVAAVLGGGTLSIYKNGVLGASVASGSTADTTYPMAIARGFGGYFEGEIEEVRCFNRALNAQEIAYLYRESDADYYSPLDAIISGLEIADAVVDGSVLTASAELLAGSASVVDEVLPPPDVGPIFGSGPFKPIYWPDPVFPRNAHIDGVLLVAQARLESGVASISINTPAVVQNVWASIHPGQATSERNWTDDELFILLEAT